MFRSSFAHFSSILLALSAISLAYPQRGNNWGWVHTQTITQSTTVTSIDESTQAQNTQTQNTQTQNTQTQNTQTQNTQTQNTQTQNTQTQTTQTLNTQTQNTQTRNTQTVTNTASLTATTADTQTNTGTGGSTGTVPATNTVASAPSSTSTSGGTIASGKRGIAYNASSPGLDILDTYPNIGWGVDWSSQRAQLPSKFTFVPMLWGDAPIHTNSWDADVKAANPQHVLSFNEPDYPTQANLPVSQAVSSHIKWMNPKSNNAAVQIGSVSVTNGVANNGAPPMGLEYLSRFLSQCAAATPNPCIVDFVQVHWYGCTNGCGVAADLSAFKSHMTSAISTAKGKDVWITEFQHFGSETDQQSFIKQALTWLDDPAQSKIAKYAYFMVLDGILTSGGSLNSAGQAFAA